MTAITAIFPRVTILVVGKAQPKSKRLQCSKCQAMLEYLESDVRETEGLRYVDCPTRSCKNANYLGTV